VKIIPFLMALFVVAALSAKASGPVFGNSPDGGNGFSLVAYNGLSMSGGAVGFTPTENISLTSVTLWLTGFTGQNGQTINVSIWDNSGSAPYAPLMTLGAPAANNGSLGAFTFDNPVINPADDPSHSTVLSANREYWLVVTAGDPFGNCLDSSTWVGGGMPTGNAIFDAADSYNVYGGSFCDSSSLPAFAIDDPNPGVANPVPEPGSLALLSIPLLFGLARWFSLRRKAQIEALKPVRLKVTSSRKLRD
jgi:hypothetical protein